MITIFKNIFSKDPFYVPIEKALERISNGNSKVIVDEIRQTLDKEKANKLKANLPSVCFSGEFGKDRKDEQLLKHSGYLVLDFDNIEDLRSKQTEIISQPFIYACWVSPSGNGLKALIKIADGTKHREHFQALQDIFPEIDRSGINVSRVCYESYDPEIYISQTPQVFKKIKKIEKVKVTERNEDEYSTFKKLLTWLANRNDAFVKGERNTFIFKLASACCKFGVSEMSASGFIQSEFLSNSEFPKTEAERAIRSAYRTNSSIAGSVCFEKEVLVDKVSRKEVVINADIYDESIKPKDVIYGIDVKEQALAIYENGYERLRGVNIQELDYLFKPKKGELTLLTGYGNSGKSTFKKWYQTMRVILYGEKFATFSPEDNPPEEYYHDFVEVILGCDCTPNNRNRPSKVIYERVYDWISQYIFYVYPKDVKPTPEYIKEVFLELIIKEKVDGCDIDPFNRMSNDYTGFAGRDKYLEFVLADFARFAQMNNVYLWIIAHPIKAVKDATGNYPCPNVFDVADGAMWNNMVDNLLVYHRPLSITHPKDPSCEFHSKKIRRQKSVGKRGDILFEMVFESRRFYFSGVDFMGRIMNEKKLDFEYQQTEIKLEPIKETYKNDYLQNLSETDLPF